jgi:hypothetical protein
MQNSNTKVSNAYKLKFNPNIDINEQYKFKFFSPLFSCLNIHMKRQQNSLMYRGDQCEPGREEIHNVQFRYKT